MPTLKIMGFDGLVPRESATMLGDSQAQQADNVKLYSKELRYWRGPTLAFSPAISGVQTIYKHYASTSYWLTWTGDVNVAQSPTTDTSDYRLYYTGDGVPKKTNETLISTGTGAYPRGWLNMGVPAPAAAPTVTPNAGTGSTESRAYVYTYVSTFGALKEESAPSPAALSSSVYVSAGATISAFSAAPTSGYNITHIRIYRSVTGATSDAYAFVAEIAVATSSYNDTLTSAQLGSALGTIGWTTPPSDLAGLVALPSGALAGFSGNTVYFSVPYYPHAWPIAYAVNIPFKIVGLGVFGSSVVVMTDRYPHIINGGIPGAMSVERVPILEPCVAKKSIVSGVDGVLYASPNGLVSIGYSTRSIISNNLFRRDEWQAYNPTAIQATSYDNKYVAIYATNDTSSFVLSPDDIPALSKINVQASAVHVDNSTGQLFYCAVSDGKIYQADSDDLNPITYQWKSKRFQLPQPTTFSALRLDADYSQASTSAAYIAQIAAIKAHNATLFSSNLLGALNTAPLNQSYYDSFYTSFPYRGITVNGSILSDIPPDASARSVQVQLYGDGSLQTTLNLTSFDSVRIAPFKSRDLEIVIRGTVNVRSVTLATTVPEIHQ